MSVRARGEPAVPVLGFRVGPEDRAYGYVDPDDGLRRWLGTVAETMLTAPELIAPTIEMYCQYAADPSLDSVWGPVEDRSVHLYYGGTSIASVTSTGRDFKFNGYAPYELKTNEFDPEREATDDPFFQNREPTESERVAAATLARRVKRRYGESVQRRGQELRVELLAMARPRAEAARRGVRM
jgi:hypothetical protein